METTSSDKSDAAIQSLDDHLQSIRDKIVSEAKELAEANDRTLGLIDLAEAANQFAPGVRFASAEKPQSLLRALLEWTPSPILVSAVLAIVFGILGWRSNAGSAFDIAKVFAGAIVGSAATALRSK